MHMRQVVSAREDASASPESPPGGSISTTGAVLIGLTFGFFFLTFLVCLLRRRSRSALERFPRAAKRKTEERITRVYQVFQHRLIMFPDEPLMLTVNTGSSRAARPQRRTRQPGT